MPERIDELARRLERSLLLAYKFENRQLSFHLYHTRSSRIYGFLLPTDAVIGRSISTDPSHVTCSIRLIELGRRLDIRHERYFPPEDNLLLLQDARDRLTLAYGRRCEEYGWFLSLDAEYPILSCLVRHPADIAWTIE